ncbi:glycoside hydrolase family 130 protein [Vallitalea pronyensis]|uniref:Glycoside hydrolase family 130 protein n=1 Tax=Vallitalea pronyensis TaxID=1348613 RepID=A0A8J8SFY9_9FIRM|nr:glycoside hydrolase family 130 protein [Vallitalea pronyensis]QUI22076.1 glycoside hydrolase family 130 protein [Vallitalea pronyensis]
MTIIGQPLKNIPWEEKPENCNEPMWRYSKNPIIPKNAIPSSNSIFNSAVVPYEDGFAGVFRCDTKARLMNINAGFSKDGLNWQIEHHPIEFKQAPGHDFIHSDYKYDPRVVQLDDKYYIQWCNGYHGPTIGMGYTEDFKEYYQMENAFMPYNRNGVLFPRKIDGMYMMLSRPSDNGHTPFGDIWLSKSPDLKYWGEHRFVMGTASFEESAWQCTKIGAGPAPIETSEGWLLFYHGVLHSCNGFVYAMGVALLDIHDPSIIIARSKPYLLTPEKDYECVGDVHNVIFPCAALSDAETGRIVVYYGGADTVVGCAFCKVDELIPWLFENNL